MVVLYAIIARGMFRATEPLRHETIKIGTQLLNDKIVNERQKRRIRKALADVHSERRAWEITLLLFFLTVTCPFHKFDLPKSDEVRIPEYMRDSLQQFQIRWVISTVANSPAAALIFTFLVSIVLAFAQSLRALSDILMVKYHGYDEEPAKIWELSGVVPQGGRSRGGCHNGAHPVPSDHLATQRAPLEEPRCADPDLLLEEVVVALVGKNAPGHRPCAHSKSKRGGASAFWADNIHLKARLEDQAQCILVIIGATPEGKNEVVGFTDGMRERAESWRKVGAAGSLTACGSVG
jgi:hypothetical protein